MLMKLKHVCLAIVVPFLVLAMPAQADEAQDVSALIKAGQLDQALQKADAFLATKPRDAQMRFLKGSILTAQGQNAEAIKVYLSLTEDFPDLPEPYNNLAVLLADQGQYDKARAALEMAVRVAPGFATAHENLGDIYVQLAIQSYEKATQIDTTGVASQRKLKMARDLISSGNKLSMKATGR